MNFCLLLDNNVQDFLCCLPWTFMFPNSNNFPPCFFQQLICFSIACLILLYFVSPKFSISFCLGSMFWAAMPEAPINENRHLCRSKHNICSSIKRLDRSDIDSITQAFLMQFRTKGFFRSSVPWLSCLHSIRSGFRRWDRLLYLFCGSFGSGVMHNVIS